MRRVAMVRLLGAGLLIVLSACADQPPPRSTQAFPIYFSRWSALMDDAALNAIGKVADMMKSDSAERISITGYADLEGSTQANQLLAQTRAQVVLDQLVTDGVPASRMSVASSGSVGYTQTSQESRRVVISVNRF